MMSDQNSDALVMVFLRNSFYRRQYLLALAAVGLSIVVIGVLGWVLTFLLRNPTHPLYFATDSISRIIPIVPVSQPNMSTDQVAAWTVKAVQKAYSYDYVNYRAQLQQAERYFTTYGWNQYISALTAADNLRAIQERKWVVIAQVIEQPKLVAQGILGGHYAWKFTMSALATYLQPPYDDKSKFSNPLNITVIVERQPILQSDQGLGIVQLIATYAVNGPTQPPQISSAPGQ